MSSFLISIYLFYQFFYVAHFFDSQTLCFEFEIKFALLQEQWKMGMTNTRDRMVHS